jgi:hypothetical protein
MTFEKELSSVLFLKTSDISTAVATNASSDVGYWTLGRASQSYFVNLRQLLGDEVYNNHDYFKIRLNTFTSTSETGVAWTSFNGDFFPGLTLRGLNFVNNSFFQRTQNNGGTFGSFLAVIQLTNTANTISIFTEETNTLYFAKSSDIIELTFGFVRMYASGNSYIDANQQGQTCMPFSTFGLQVAGVPNEEILRENEGE